MRVRQRVERVHLRQLMLSIRDAILIYCTQPTTKKWEKKKKVESKDPGYALQKYR